ncbi:hypothetical protein NUU61_008532 [Penicillium alfredii]|uniref:Uncharacterized protein n=1 Tax=Penicillium alfredii TaxID=1506179 RepID=A0A9W9JWB3_9EURO|nr:uncharacterized protein NUU61_008532 [Penicillium alfredii]KAJ5083953.1 hypothetical protein NUU61_008532 [Penicillium alfredii]
MYPDEQLVADTSGFLTVVSLDKKGSAQDPISTVKTEGPTNVIVERNPQDSISTTKTEDPIPISTKKTEDPTDVVVERNAQPDYIPTPTVFALSGGPTGTPVSSGESQALDKRDTKTACTPKNPKGHTTKPPEPTKGPRIDCKLLFADPNQGRNHAECLCDGSTWPVLPVSTGEQSDSCAYSTTPAHITNPNPSSELLTRTWTSQCQACTEVGGLYNDNNPVHCTKVPSCTTTKPAKPAEPTMRVTFANDTIPIGDWNNANQGADLRKKLYDGFTGDDGPCTGSISCDSSKDLVFDDIPAVGGGGVEYLKLTFNVQESSFVDASELHKMLCEEVEYKSEPDQTESGCGSSPVKRDLQPWFKKRTPICEMCNPPQEECTYHATICSAPKQFHVARAANGDPYAQYLDVEVTAELEGMSGMIEFECEMFAEAVEGTVIVVTTFFPEAAAVAGEASVADADFVALCQKMSGG